jgi:ABC-type sugar transport system ATPase subunit
MGIDIKAKNEIMSIIRKVAKKNCKCSIIISASDPEQELMELTNRVWWLEKGRLILNEIMDTIQ